MLPKCQYDPLINDFPSNQAWPNSYWASTVVQPQSHEPLAGTIKADVAIIGAGYTGMLTAYYLASQFNIDCVVLEANQVGFGASGRNAGFVLKGSGRVGYGQMAKKWGLEVTKGIYNEFTQAVERVDGLIQDNHIACDKQEQGYLKIAHNRKQVTQLQTAAEFVSQSLGGKAEFIVAERFKQQYMAHSQSYGAMRYPDGFGINPLKLALGYRTLLAKLGIALYEQTPVTGWYSTDSGHILTTPNGKVQANTVISAGNAYTPKRFNSGLDNRYLPILSNVIVTNVLSDDVLTAAGISTHQMAMDTRRLKYYYRLLPDNRLLFGGRGAINGSESDDPKYARRLHKAMIEAFPQLRHSQIDFNWTGWIAAALDDMPHVYHKQHTAYSIGYCGAGVSFSAQAAYRLAQSVVGEAVPALPLYQQPLPAFPFSRLRRVGQRAYYHYAWLMDKYG